MRNHVTIELFANLASLASRYYGIPLKVCKTHAETLERMKYRIITAIGESNQSYSHSKLTPIHGTGQGSSASPSIWLMISSILIYILKDNQQGMRMTSVDKQMILQQVREGFVDDTTIRHSM